MATNIPTELVQATTIVDQKTSQPTQDLLQKLNAIIRALRDLDARITALGG